jgi:hypothetical protein
MKNNESIPVYEVLNPRAKPPLIRQSPLSPRQTDLSGKKVYVIDMHIEGTYLFMEKVAELLPDLLPEAQSVFKTKLSVYSSDDPELWNEVVKNASAFIFGPGAATSGFTFGALWSIELEKRGVPGVFVLSEGYEHAVRLTCNRQGMPQLRRVVTPSPPWGSETLNKQMPRIMEEIVDCLTTPLADDEKSTRDIVPHETPTIAMKGNFHDVQEFFIENRWTDGLPIVPPTRENVANMLAGTSHAPDEIVTDAMPPLKWTVTVEKVAINGVMAGCRPEHMPVLLAIVDAFATGSFVASVQSANSFCFMVLVNGPIAKKVGMNSGVNALGPGNRANASIGRALRLFLTNLGGIEPGVTLMACQGNNSNYSFAFAENEEASPWEPFHVSMGFKREESTVTILSGGWGHGGNGAGRRDESVNLDHIIEIMKTFQLPWGAVILVSPLLAKQISDERGFTKHDLQDYLHKNTTKTAIKFKSDPYYNTFIEPVLRGKSIYGSDNIWPAWYLEANDNELVPVYGKSEFILPVVVGGDAYAVFQAWKMAFPSSVSIDRWV